jgi:glycine/D-amino acid oxidase-like deaminating enzyme
MDDLEEADGLLVWGTLDGENFENYKIGDDFATPDPHQMLRVMKKILPSKIEKISNISACYYSMTHNWEFIFEKHGNTVYAFGCNGLGFKYMPYHGKRIYHLLTGN